MTSATTINSQMTATTSEQLAAPNCMVRVSSFNAFTQISLVPLFDLTRWELQARILADQPAEEIAAAMNLPVGLVAAFEADSFDVRPQLKHPSIVLHTIIGIPLTEEWSAADVGRLWQWLGYTYGADVLDVAIPPFLRLSSQLRELGLRAYLSPVCDICEDFRILVASKLLPVAATCTSSGDALIGKLRRTTERRVRPIELLTMLLDLVPQREPTKVISQPKRQLRESA